MKPANLFFLIQGNKSCEDGDELTEEVTRYAIGRNELADRLTAWLLDEVIFTLRDLSIATLGNDGKIIFRYL